MRDCPRWRQTSSIAPSQRHPTKKKSQRIQWLRRNTTLKGIGDGKEFYVCALVWYFFFLGSRLILPDTIDAKTRCIYDMVFLPYDAIVCFLHSLEGKIFILISIMFVEICLKEILTIHHCAQKRFLNRKDNG